MKFPKSYKCLTQNEIIKGNYKIVPIRFEDRMDIMKWRNEQMYHLRQTERLTADSQMNYFTNTIASLFEEHNPSQLLFSYLKEDLCIGYGGLVNINWHDKNAEVSFIMDTQLEQDYFHKHWTIYLNLLDEISFKELGLAKIYTYAFDIRPHLYSTLESNGFVKEAELKKHCLIETRFENVIIHSKFNPLDH